VKAINDKGFTLIEMMVVVALIGIMLSIAVPSILSQRPLWKSNGTARELLTNMRMTQSKAIRAGEPHAITFFTATKKYTIFSDNGDGGGTAGDGIQNGTEATVKEVPLGTTIAYGVIGTPPAMKGGAIQADGVNFTLRSGNKSVIFRPDGSAEDGTVYLYPTTAATTAGWQRAVEVVGNTGRVKIYSYDTGTANWI